jgi:hypothetical protein
VAWAGVCVVALTAGCEERERERERGPGRLTREAERPSNHPDATRGGSTVLNRYVLCSTGRRLTGGREHGRPSQEATALTEELHTTLDAQRKRPPPGALQGAITTAVAAGEGGGENATDPQGAKRLRSHLLQGAKS